MATVDEYFNITQITFYLLKKQDRKTRRARGKNYDIFREVKFLQPKIIQGLYLVVVFTYRLAKRHRRSSFPFQSSTWSVTLFHP